MRSCYGVTTWGFAMSKDKRVGDLGGKALDLLYAKLMVDDDWSVRTDRGSRGGRTASRDTSR